MYGNFAADLSEMETKNRHCRPEKEQRLSRECDDVYQQLGQNCKDCDKFFLLKLKFIILLL